MGLFDKEPTAEEQRLIDKTQQITTFLASTKLASISFKKGDVTVDSSPKSLITDFVIKIKPIEGLGIGDFERIADGIAKAGKTVQTSIKPSGNATEIGILTENGNIKDLSDLSVEKAISVIKTSIRDRGKSEKAKSELASVPQILAILENNNDITKEQKDDVLAHLKDEQYKGKFAGEIAVLREHTTTEVVEEGLRQQSVLMAQAAVNDMQTLTVEKKTLDLPEWMKPHWGNNEEVNDISKNITRDEAGAAAANLGKLIVLLANKNPSISEDVQEGVVAAKNLTALRIKGNDASTPIEKSAEWMGQAELALVRASEEDLSVSDKIVEKYLGNRTFEISKGIELAREAEVNKNRQKVF